MIDPPRASASTPRRRGRVVTGWARRAPRARSSCPRAAAGRSSTPRHRAPTRRSTICRTSAAAPVRITALPAVRRDGRPGTARAAGLAGTGRHLRRRGAVARRGGQPRPLGPASAAATGAPVLRYGRPLPGRGGITVRHLELQPPTDAVAAGGPLTIGVDARGARYRWNLCALGARRPVLRGRDTRHAAAAAGAGRRDRRSTSSRRAAAGSPRRRRWRSTLPAPGPASSSCCR